MADTGRPLPLPGKLLALAFGLVCGLLLAEVVTRLLVDDSAAAHPRLELYYSDATRALLAHCYPSDPFDQLPTDLRRAEHREHFTRTFPALWPTDPHLKGNPALDVIARSHDTAAAVAYAREHTPDCLLYVLNPPNRRFRFSSPEPKERIAVLGDSFAFGQGVISEQTFGARLSARRNADVSQYGTLGANLDAVRGQHGRALATHGAQPLDGMVYLFVLNDPYMSQELAGRQRYINDLMNVRWLSAGAPGGGFSALVRFVGRRWSLHSTTSATVDWYRAIFDGQQNPRLAESFDAIGEMAGQARARGVRFVVAVYPLMVGFHDYPFGAVHRTIREQLGQRGVEVVDLLPAFEAAAANREAAWIVHPIDYHPNGPAHDVAAAAVARTLGADGR